jgi:hydrogenase maturation protein HypF
VLNSSQGVFIEVEGEKDKLENFVLNIDKEKPSISFIQNLEYTYLDPAGYKEFEIRKSDSSGEKTALILPDIATCKECLTDIFDQENRRYLYPFTNCTNCGPRYSIIESLPYDRPRTTMKKFIMCEKCKKEYDDPTDRRFHAQPNACPKCGPHIELWNKSGKLLDSKHKAIEKTIKAIKTGEIVALKGLGGFHIITEACNNDSVLKLRIRKHREEKPFALMYPDIETVKRDCEVTSFEERLLLSSQSPIVLLKRKNFKTDIIAESVAPGNPYLGVMLPYTPLHHILMHFLKSPVVATSGNHSEEPICTDEYKALEKLDIIVDFFLVHNRSILRHVDDSIVSVVMEREMVLRRARGYAPLPINSKYGLSNQVSVGGHLKNTISMSREKQVFVSQHIGDLETVESFSAFKNTLSDFRKLYNIIPERVACDLHPDYISSKFASDLNLPITKVQHHVSHIVSCMEENQLEGPLLGISWDGTGFGTDDTVWGSEFFLLKDKTFVRKAHFRKFRLPGGENSIKEINRIAAGILYEIFGKEVFNNKSILFLKYFSNEELKIIESLLSKKFNSPETSSAGRLFDAVASILNLRQRVNYEGQAAMELEYLTNGCDSDEHYTLKIVEKDFEENNYIIDWEPMMREILVDKLNDLSLNLMSVKFHNTLSKIILDIAKKIGEEKIVMSGGCFQNRYLIRRTVKLLESENFKPYWHQRIPPNDGGISLGQIIYSSLNYKLI